MGYMHIQNLYKNQTVLMFKQLYALEKVHGSSAHISFKYFPDIKTYQTDKEEPIYVIPGRYEVGYFSGGEKYENFIKLFNSEDLAKRALELGFNKDFIVYGEAYGGKMQGMSGTYGKNLKFIAFELKIGERFTDVPFADEVVQKLGLEFVHYEIIDACPVIIDQLANSPSVQAKRNGIENPELPREGVVLRPLKEFLQPDGVGRIMAKHKNDIYKEREHAPKLQSAEELQVLEDAKAISEEWCHPMRLEHVVDHLKAEGVPIEEKSMNKIIAAMVEDIEREAKGEIVWSKPVRKAISQKTAKMLIERFKKEIKE